MHNIVHVVCMININLGMLKHVTISRWQRKISYGSYFSRKSFGFDQHCLHLSHTLHQLSSKHLAVSFRTTSETTHYKNSSIVLGAVADTIAFRYHCSKAQNHIMVEGGQL